MKPPDWRPPILTTTRLTLRAFEDTDAESLFPLASNANVTRFTLWDHHKTIADTLVFVRDYAQLRYREGTTEPYAITMFPDPRPIGSCGCFWASIPNRTMELGYWVAEQFWGKGIAVEASRAVVSLAFREFEPERMQARVIAGNVASLRVLDKLGFRYEGTLRSSLLRRGKFEDVLIYSMLRSEWRDDPEVKDYEREGEVQKG
jgi:ribosomal-protein-alanine N-acetyltransferase